MTFVFPVLLGSLALIGIPVLIHLIMRKKPKIEPFPAFRFLLQRQRINVRRLRLRHWCCWPCGFCSWPASAWPWPGPRYFFKA